MDAWAGFNMNMGDAPDNTAGHPSRHVDPDATPDHRTYALFTHLSLVLAHMGIMVIPPLVLWLIKRKESHFIDDHAKEALNFQISLLIYALVSTVLVPACGIGIVGWVATYALGIVGMIMASVAANRGELFRYPATIRLVK
jgi:uncharacterized Tic20 family protein